MSPRYTEAKEPCPSRFRSCTQGLVIGWPWAAVACTATHYLHRREVEVVGVLARLALLRGGGLGDHGLGGRGGMAVPRRRLGLSCGALVHQLLPHRCQCFGFRTIQPRPQRAQGACAAWPRPLRLNMS
jgi:hypothetical protein